VEEAWAGRSRCVYGELIWLTPLVAVARIRASFQRPHEPTIPTPPRGVRARAARDVFAAAGIHGGYHDDSGVEGRTCEWTDPCSASISWSACVAWRHSSQMSPRRASSEVSVSIAAMGANDTRHYGVGGSAKGHSGGRFDRGWKRGGRANAPEYAAGNAGGGRSLLWNSSRGNTPKRVSGSIHGQVWWSLLPDRMVRL
jgi:hypothetical protein